MTDMTFYCRGCEEELPKEKKREKKETTYNRLKRELIDTKCERDKWKIKYNDTLNPPIIVLVLVGIGLGTLLYFLIN